MAASLRLKRCMVSSEEMHGQMQQTWPLVNFVLSSCYVGGKGLPSLRCVACRCFASEAPTRSPGLAQMLLVACDECLVCMVMVAWRRQPAWLYGEPKGLAWDAVAAAAGLCWKAGYSVRRCSSLVVAIWCKRQREETAPGMGLGMHACCMDMVWRCHRLVR